MAFYIIDILDLNSDLNFILHELFKADHGSFLR